MRISDWSSDVCSSDLLLVHLLDFALQPLVARLLVVKRAIHRRPRRPDNGNRGDHAETQHLHELLLAQFAALAAPVAQVDPGGHGCGSSKARNARPQAISSQASSRSSTAGFALGMALHLGNGRPVRED